MNKKVIWFAVLMFVFLLLIFSQTKATEVQANAEVSFMSACVIRGQVINDEPVAQPFLNISKNGFSVNAWGNYNLTDRITEDRDFNELDFTVQYTLPVKVLEINAGLIEYVYPNCTLKETREVFTQIKYPNYFVTPVCGVYYDIDEVNGTYIIASLYRDVQLLDNLILTPSVSTGYGTSRFNKYYFGSDNATLNSGSADTVLKYIINSNWFTSVRISYTWLWDSEVRDSAKEIYFKDNLLYGGVTVGYTF
jgi:hypothetical protein